MGACVPMTGLHKNDTRNHIEESFASESPLLCRAQYQMFGLTPCCSTVAKTLRRATWWICIGGGSGPLGRLPLFKSAVDDSSDSSIASKSWQDVNGSVL